MKKGRRTEPFYLVEQEGRPDKKRMAAAVLALCVILLVGVITAARMDALAPTFNGKVDVAALEQDPSDYSLEEADGAAYVVVAQNLEKTEAKNVCFSVVFNFRGYDTMGESFILIAALSGSLCILREPKHRKARETAKGKGERQNG